MFDDMASEMANVHNMFIRGLNSIYLQAPHIKPADEKLFARYVVGWYAALHSHHAGEERSFFPGVERMTGVQGIMDTNKEQHEAFHDGLDALQAYCKAVMAGTERYDGAKVVGMVDGFGPALVQHLNDEIPSILNLRQHGDKLAGLPKLFDDEAQEAMVCPLLFILTRKGKLQRLTTRNRRKLASVGWCTASLTLTPTSRTACGRTGRRRRDR